MRRVREPVTNSTVGPSIRLYDVKPEREIRTIMMTGSSTINLFENKLLREIFQEYPGVILSYLLQWMNYFPLFHVSVINKYLIYLILLFFHTKKNKSPIIQLINRQSANINMKLFRGRFPFFYKYPVNYFNVLIYKLIIFLLFSVSFYAASFLSISLSIGLFIFSVVSPNKLTV